jgi:tetratricopeptide (TPR) repeat protein
MSKRARFVVAAKLFIIFVFAISLRAATTASEAIAEADRLFGYGAEPANERRALELLDSAVKESPADYSLLWRAARSYYYTGDGVAAKERVKYFERGIEIANRAIAQNANGVEGHFWLAANQGGICREKGGLTAFKMVKKVRAELEIVLRLNDAYEEASVYTALGQIDRQVPGLFGGDIKRSIARLEQGLKIAPGNLELKQALAESYVEANRKADARRQLEDLLQLPLPAARANENLRAQVNARTLLAKLNKK